MLGAARRNWLVWFVVLPVALWTLVRVFGLEAGFPLVPLMAFTPYVAVAAFLVAGVAVALRNWVAATVAALATFCLAAAVLPRAIGDGTVEAAGHRTLAVLSVNVHHGTADAAALVTLVDKLDPDLLSVQELTPSFARRLRAAGIERRLPRTVFSTEHAASGAGIYARVPLRRLPHDESEIAFRMPRVEISLPAGQRLRLVNVHPFPPNPNRVGEWESVLAGLPTTGTGSPWILAGDFNATLDQEALRGVVDRGYRDAGEGLVPTWPADEWNYRLPPVTIDHVLADRRLGVVEYSVEDLPETDHRPVFAVLALP